MTTFPHTFPDWVKRGEKFKAYGFIWEVLRIKPLVQARRWNAKGHWHYRYFREWQFDRDIKRTRQA